MPANIDPIFTATPNIGKVKIGTTSAQVKSSGISAGTGTDLMYKVFTAGPNGSLLEKIQFRSVAAAAAVAGVATCLRAYLSTVSDPTTGTTADDTHLIGEIYVPAAVASHSINPAGLYEMYLDMVIPANHYVHVSQHVAQTANQSWQALAIGGDY